LQRFPRCYRKWLRERQVRAAMESALSAEDLELVLRDYPMLGPVDPARQVVLRDEVERALKGLDIQTRTAVILQDAGYPQTEAAAQAGLSIDALSGRLRRYRWRGESNGE
jgi:DNA-directed RNA polymerase specialized sigma24 family protein